MRILNSFNFLIALTFCKTFIVYFTATHPQSCETLGFRRHYLDTKLWKYTTFQIFIKSLILIALFSFNTYWKVIKTNLKDLIEIATAKTAESKTTKQILRKTSAITRQGCVIFANIVLTVNKKVYVPPSERYRSQQTNKQSYIISLIEFIQRTLLPPKNIHIWSTRNTHLKFS